MESLENILELLREKFLQREVFLPETGSIGQGVGHVM